MLLAKVILLPTDSNVAIILDEPIAFRHFSIQFLYQRRNTNATIFFGTRGCVPWGRDTRKEIEEIFSSCNLKELHLSITSRLVFILPS
jgi:hypothetical protein